MAGALLVDARSGDGGNRCAEPRARLRRKRKPSDSACRSLYPRARTGASGVRSEDVRFVWLFVFLTCRWGQNQAAAGRPGSGNFSRRRIYDVADSRSTRACAAVRMRPKNTPSA
jgi:hypothetical protein